MAQRAARVIGFIALMFVVTATPARADAIAFMGAITGNNGTPAIGVAFGRFPQELDSIVGFDLEIVRTPGGPRSGRSWIETFGGNLLVQWSVHRRALMYAAGGPGVYAETTGDGGGTDLVGYGNAGGGIKISVAGPLMVRLDYRLMIIGHADASAEVPRHRHRATVGFGLAF